MLVPGSQHDDELARERVDALVLVVLGGDDEREYVTALDDPAAGCVCDAVAGDLPPLIHNQRGRVRGIRGLGRSRRAGRRARCRRVGEEHQRVHQARYDLAA